MLYATSVSADCPNSCTYKSNHKHTHKSSKAKNATHKSKKCKHKKGKCPQSTSSCMPKSTVMPPKCRAPASAPCYVVGGNREFCSSEPEMHIAVNEWRIEDQCYVEYGICERDANGKCGWRNTNELSQCLVNMRSEIAESVEPCIPH